MTISSEIRIGNCRLICADCRDVAGVLQADALITDPVWPNCPPGLIEGSKDPYALWSDFWRAMPSLKRSDIVMRVDSDPRFLQAVPYPFARVCMLPYAVPNYMGRNLGGDEIAYCFGKHIKFQKGRRVVPGRAPIAQSAQKKNNPHPCPRAQVHFDWLVNWWSDDGETVIDPFMGSGTTAIACLKHHRKFIGIEIDRGHFDNACERIERALDQMTMEFSEAS